MYGPGYLILVFRASIKFNGWNESFKPIPFNQPFLQEQFPLAFGTIAISNRLPALIEIVFDIYSYTSLSVFTSSNISDLWSNFTIFNQFGNFPIRVNHLVVIWRSVTDGDKGWTQTLLLVSLGQNRLQHELDLKKRGSVVSTGRIWALSVMWISTGHSWGSSRGLFGS